MANRSGIGYDVHKLVKGRPLILGGVKFESDKGLQGHSDADVLCHAVGDALLGAMAMGDLGTHFPPGDKQWKDASSLDLLKLIRALIDGQGGTIVNVDVSVVCEAPKLAPRRDEMVLNVAQALRISASQVSVKATTNEKLGFLGRSEGIAAMAVAMVSTASGPDHSRARGAADELKL